MADFLSLYFFSPVFLFICIPKTLKENKAEMKTLLPTLWHSRIGREIPNMEEYEIRRSDTKKSKVVPA